MQLHRHVVLADRLQRLFERDLPPVDREALRLQLLRDIARRHRAEQMLVLADLPLEHQLNLVQLGRQRFSRRLLLRRLAHCGGLHLLDHGLVGRRRFNRQLARQQIVAPVTVGNLHHIAAMSKLVDVFLQNDFHCSLSRFPDSERAPQSRSVCLISRLIRVDNR